MVGECGVNFVVFYFSPTCCPYDVIFKLFVGFITSNFMMCKSFDGRYVCVLFVRNIDQDKCVLFCPMHSSLSF
jgi:hypothetical protein